MYIYICNSLYKKATIIYISPMCRMLQDYGGARVVSIFPGLVTVRLDPPVR